MKKEFNHFVKIKRNIKSLSAASIEQIHKNRSPPQD